MTDALRTTVGPVLQLLRRLTGQARIEALLQQQSGVLENQRAELAAMEARLRDRIRAAEVNVCEHVDAVLAGQDTDRAELRTQVEALTEIVVPRLDAILTAQAADRSALDHLDAKVSVETDLLDGYVAHRLQELQSQLESRLVGGLGSDQPVGA